MAARVRWDDLPVAGGVRAAAARLGVDPVALACGGGEDFALLAALPPDAAGAAVAAAGAAEGVAAAIVGVCAERDPAQPAATLVMGDASVRDLSGLGYDHYARRA